MTKSQIFFKITLLQMIKQIVPPILKMSRKLQQDPEYLKTHPWFAYLKPLPKADQMWEGNKKIQ